MGGLVATGETNLERDRQPFQTTLLVMFGNGTVTSSVQTVTRQMIARVTIRPARQRRYSASTRRFRSLSPFVVQLILRSRAVKERDMQLSGQYLLQMRCRFERHQVESDPRTGRTRYGENYDVKALLLSSIYKPIEANTDVTNRSVNWLMLEMTNVSPETIPLASSMRYRR